ncbi:MAG: Z1 domain-containing protein [Selenomonadaceae bacterium]|nr:Z1 domain-containing protein [Selenomonadaceae bacterium]
MTDIESARVTETAWKNVVDQTEPLGRPPTEAEFQAVADKIKLILPILHPNIKISADDYEKIFRTIRGKITVQMSGTDAVVESGKHQKWLDSVRADVDWFFWTRYEKYLRLDKKWSPVLTAALNTTSDNILDLTGKPNSARNFSRRGLIIGEVQSGKTATYTALCAKAADVGYKVIIVLTGTLEDLRRQTQARLDFEFAGRRSQDFLSKDNAVRNIPVGVAKYNHNKSIAQFTSVEYDFNASLLKSFSLDLKNLNGTALFVVKKNKTVLNNLIKWLKQSVDYGASKIKYSLLLLDDEADNASINTNDVDEDPTAINACIREILNLFDKTTYIGVTATPFANIFINPSDENEMLGDDLFPRDFIYALDVPDNYIGAEKLFGGDEYRNFVVPLDDDVEDIFPKKHNQNLPVTNLPESLCEAINYFLLVNAIRDLRGEAKSHRTMLINVSGWQNIHAQTYDLVNARLQEIVRDLRAYAALPVAEAERNSVHIAALRKVFDKFKIEELGGVSWEKILHENLRRAVEPVKVGLRNATKQHPFSYEQTPDGLRVIAIGGNSFSRGLTLEGLCVTYFYRNSRNYDTLMQMGRWFGYRPNYGDLCRLWTTQEIVDLYGYISNVSDELKREIIRMEHFGKTPKDFGLKVRRHPDTLEITARNKMRLGTAVVCPVELNRIFLETPRLIRDEDVLSANEKLIRDFVDGLKNFSRDSDTQKFLWHDVPKNLVAQLVLNFKTGSWARYQARPISEYIAELDEDFWDVSIPVGVGEIYGGLTLGGEQFSFNPVARTVSVDDDEIKIGGSNLQVATPRTAQAGLTAEQIKRAEDDFHALKKSKAVSENAYLIHGRRPLLVVFAIRPKIENAANVTDVPKILFALGVGFPALDPTISESQIKTAEFVINAVGSEDGDDW